MKTVELRKLNKSEQAIASGSFKRPSSQFRNWISAEENAEYPVETGRYKLFLSHACPWAHRVLAVRTLLGLEDYFEVVFVKPVMSLRGWVLDSGLSMMDIYQSYVPDYEGKASVPLLVDDCRGEIVNNESSEIMEMMAREFPSPGEKEINLYPVSLSDEIAALSQEIQRTVNEAVYQAGFALSLEAHLTAKETLKSGLIELEKRLSVSPKWLLGEVFTAVDIRLWTTLVRFDAAYVEYLKCSDEKLDQYPSISAYLKRFDEFPALKATVNQQEINLHFYNRVKDLAATGTPLAILNI